MNDREAKLVIVREWVQKAENDLVNSVHALKLGDECPADTVCFHAQQCVEKYVKAALVAVDREFPKTHDIEKLLPMLPAKARPFLAKAELDHLAVYAIAARYPGVGEVHVEEARTAVALAQRVREKIRSFLPKESLRRKKR